MNTVEITRMAHVAPFMTFVRAKEAERAARIEFAVRLLRAGLTRREVSGRIRQRYGCSWSTARRISYKALDFAGVAQ